MEVPRPELDRWMMESGEVLREAEDERLMHEAERDEELAWEEHDYTVPREDLDRLDWQLRHPDLRDDV